MEEFYELLAEFLYVVDETLASGEEIPDEVLGQVAETLNALNTRIEQIEQAQNPPPPPQPNEPPPIPPSTPTGGYVPPLEDAPFPSSNISRFRYDPRSRNLYIQFLGEYPNRNGSVYQYSGVPPNIFQLLQRGGVGPITSGGNRWHNWNRNQLPSHGAAAYHLIRSSFPYQRIR
jgi:hypothetical protein